MPSLKEKITHQTTTQIKLYKQGVFWVAYEHSAFFITTPKTYKPTKKYIKKLKTLVVSVGFPETALQKLLKLQEVVELATIKTENNCCCFNVKKEIDKNTFLAWKNALQETTTNQQQPKEAILEKIKNFPLHIKTPVEAFLFVKELQDAVLSI